MSLQAGQESSQNCWLTLPPFAVFFSLPFLTKTEDLLTHCLGQCGINGAKITLCPVLSPWLEYRLDTRLGREMWDCITLARETPPKIQTELKEGDKRAQILRSFRKSGPAPVSSFSDQAEPQRGENPREMRGENPREIRGVQEQAVCSSPTGQLQATSV